MWHRNSQKRFYIPNRIYFVTLVTQGRRPYFGNNLYPIGTQLCQIFLLTSQIFARWKPYILHALTVMPDHVHMMIEPLGNTNISSCVQSIKRNFAIDVNRIYGKNGTFYVPESWKRGNISKATNRFVAFTRDQQKYIEYQRIVWKMACSVTAAQRVKLSNYTPFKWQKSYHDHIIRDRKDYINHVKYIFTNCRKHGVWQNPRTYPWTVARKLKPQPSHHPPQTIQSQPAQGRAAG